MAGRGRNIAIGRGVQILPPAAQQQGPNERFIPEDIKKLWDHPTQAGRSAGQLLTQSIPRSIVIFPPEYLQPPEGVPFQQYSQSTVNAVGMTVELWSFRVPKASTLIIKAIDLYATNTTSTTDLEFSLLLNGAAYGQYGSIKLFGGSASVNSRSFNDQTFRIPENTTVSMQVIDNDGGTYEIAAGAQGWYYPNTVGDLYKWQVGVNP